MLGYLNPWFEKTWLCPIPRKLPKQSTLSAALHLTPGTKKTHLALQHANKVTCLCSSFEEFGFGPVSRPLQTEQGTPGTAAVANAFRFRLRTHNLGFEVVGVRVVDKPSPCAIKF